MYEIRVAGAVPEEDLEDMGAVQVTPEQVNTVLYGVSDQAALYGLLDRLRALGVVVVEVRRVPETAVEIDDDDESDVERPHDEVED
jgi:hypothetical protein